jgi:hypothetical protein
VDWDLLADHLGGALAGTSEEERVARLVATDPGWAQAAGQLSRALDAVAADLRTLPAAPAMPGDIAARLDANLRDLSTAVPAAVPASASPGGSPRAGRPAAPTAPATPVPATAPTGRRPGDRTRRRRRAGWGAGLVAAGGLAVFAAVALGPMGLLNGIESDDAGGDAAAAPEAADEYGRAPTLAEDADGTEGTGGPVSIATGTDYQPDSPLFTSRAAPLAPAMESQGSDPGGPAGDPGGGDALVAEVPEPLQRVFAEPQPCLALVAASFEPAPVIITTVDYARFEGTPAVVTWLTTADEGQWVMVAGPDCGAPGAGADELYRTRLD